MIDFFEGANRYWALFVGVASIFLFLGKLWANLESNTRAIKKLFEFYDDINKFKEKQMLETSNLKADSIRQHDRNNDRFDQVMVRMDDFFKALTTIKAKS